MMHCSAIDHKRDQPMMSRHDLSYNVFMSLREWRP